MIYISLLIFSVHNNDNPVVALSTDNNNGSILSYINNYNNINKKKKKKKETLALLYPPGFVGGYRNQVMRFIALVRHAQRYGQSQLLLPSILFSTTYKGQSPNRFFPIPMNEVFDVDYWNRFEKYNLPKLVNDSSLIYPADCWTSQQQQSGHYQSVDNNNNNNNNNDYDELLQELLKEYGNKIIRIRRSEEEVTFVSPMLERILRDNVRIRPIEKVTTAILKGRVELLKPRKFDLTEAIVNCTQPFVYGGGRLGGRLWNEYVAMPKYNPNNNASDATGDGDTSDKALANSQFISLVSQALLPSRQWRDVANQCVIRHQNPEIENTGDEQQQQQQRPDPYILLHTRIETDMLEHRCGREMEKNLTTILSMVESMMSQYNSHHREEERLRGTVLAVSRYGMQKSPRNNPLLQKLIDENWKTLQQNSQSFVLLDGQKGKEDDVIMMTSDMNHHRGKKGGILNLFECGELWMDRWYSQQNDVQDDYYGSLLPSILNFYIATHATVFIGVERSSWSTDVWSYRYHLGKGGSNFKYTPEGILPIPNGGLPPSHSGC